MTIWDWISEFAEQARSRGDEQRLRMTQLHNQAYVFRQEDPDQMLSILEEGRRLATALQEPWWILFFEHWKLETLIYYKDDYRGVIDLAVRLTLELRKPIYDQIPLRFGIWCNLISAYLCVDPRGYEVEIDQALRYLQTQVPDEGGDRYLLQARRHWFASELGRYAEAEQLALEELAMADGDMDRYTAQHHEIDTLKALCGIAMRQNHWETLANRAKVGDQLARKMGYHYERSLFLLWLALCARRGGQEAEAQRWLQRGLNVMGRIKQPPGEWYYEALAHFHAFREDWEQVWAIREQELSHTLDKGQFAYEAQVRIRRVELLRRLGRDTRSEQEHARSAIARLRKPQWYLAELDRALGQRD